MTLRRWHLVAGCAFVGVFIATGLYMRLTWPTPESWYPPARPLFRSAHIFILLSALVNGALGLYLAPLPGRPAWLQSAGSLAVLASPALYTASFVLESAVGLIDRPLVYFGTLLMVIGMALHLFARLSASGAGAALLLAGLTGALAGPVSAQTTGAAGSDPVQRVAAVAVTLEYWTDMWNRYDLDRVDQLFVADSTVTYFSPERDGLIRGINALRLHHHGFGFVPGGKDQAGRISHAHFANAPPEARP